MKQWYALYVSLYSYHYKIHKLFRLNICRFHETSISIFAHFFRLLRWPKVVLFRIHSILQLVRIWNAVIHFRPAVATLKLAFWFGILDYLWATLHSANAQLKSTLLQKASSDFPVPFVWLVSIHFYILIHLIYSYIFAYKWEIYITDAFEMSISDTLNLVDA